MNTFKNPDQNIPWFNPREMDDATLTALATGREGLISEFLKTVDRRLNGIAEGHAGEHWLITGTRGAGKSYFLRYAQIRTQSRFAPEAVRFVLLPEELRNLRAPHDLLDEIRRMLTSTEGQPGRAAQWRTEAPEQHWEASLQQLLAACPAPLLVVGMENFADIQERAFRDDVAASLLRKLMEHEPRILILASAVDGSFDEQYRQRLFLQFAKHPLPVWDGAAHRAYLRERARLMGRQPTSRQLARIDAYSRYTGGNARIAAILAAAILDETDMTRTSADLNATLDKMSDYYRALLDAMPANTETLFDALIRGGEPCSQTQLAERVGARQNDISRAFHWLLDGGYLLAQRPKGQKETLYQVADRLFVQWYRMRYLNPGQLSRLAVLAELLADTLEFDEKWRYAQSFSEQGENHDAMLMAELGFKDCGIDINKLNADGTPLATLLDWGKRLTSVEPKGSLSHLEACLLLLETYSGDEKMQAEIQTSLTLANCCERFEGSLPGKALAKLCLDSLSLAALEKLRVLRAIPRISQEQWDSLVRVFQDESVKFIELGQDHPDDIRKLQALRAQEWKHPWLYAWKEPVHMDRCFPTDVFTDLDKTTLQATASAVQFLHATRTPDQSDLIQSSGERLLGELYQLIHKHGLFSEALSLIEVLLASLPAETSSEWQGALLRLGAFIHSEKRLRNIHKSLEYAEHAEKFYRKMHPSPRQNRGLREAKERQGWAWGEMQNWPTAFAAHEEALTLCDTPRDVSWNAGQAARYVWHIRGLEAAWNFIHRQTLTDTQDILRAIGQIGDAVYDVERQENSANAYTKARELFTHLRQAADLPLPGILRWLFIDMVDTGLSLDTLRDLIADLPEEFGSIDERNEIAELGRTLDAWISRLQTKNLEKLDSNTTMTIEKPNEDPDLQLTLNALDQALSIDARIRLGLTLTPTISPSAATLKARMMAFLR